MVICSIATELKTDYKQLDCVYLNKKTNEMVEKYAELEKLLNNRLADIDSKKNTVSSLLNDQENIMGSLKEFNEHIDAILVTTLSLPHIDELLKELQVSILLLPVYIYIGS